MGINYVDLLVSTAALAIGLYKTQVQESFPIFKAPILFLTLNSLLVQFRQSESFYDWSTNLARDWGQTNPEVIVLLVVFSAGFSTFLFGYALLLDWRLTEAIRLQGSKIIQLSCKLAQCRIAMNKRAKLGGRVLASMSRVSPDMRIPLLQDALDITIDKSDMQSIIDCLTTRPSSATRYSTKKSRRSKKSSRRKSKRSLPKKSDNLNVWPFDSNSPICTDDSREVHPAELGYNEHEIESDPKDKSPSLILKEKMKDGFEKKKTGSSNLNNSFRSDFFTCNLHQDLSNKERGNQEKHMTDTFFKDGSTNSDGNNTDLHMPRSPGSVLSAKLGSWMVGKNENWRVVERKQDLFDFELDYED